MEKLTLSGFKQLAQPDEDKQLTKLPVERRAEDEALAAIRVVRERQRGRDERGRDGIEIER